MELLQLEYFITLAECQHMTRAANSLMISQPSLSNTLSRIEKELGVKLFDRQGRNIVLNPYGKILLDHAKNIFRELDNIQTEIDALKQVQSSTITIGSIDSIYVKDWLPFFINNNPDITVHHIICSSTELETQLEKGDIDFAITTPPVNQSDFDMQYLGSDELLILSPQATDIDDTIPQEFLTFAKEPFLCTPKNDNILRAIDILSDAVGVEPDIVFEGEQILLSRMFNLGYGSIITPKSNIVPKENWDIYKENFKIYFLTDPQAHFDVNLVWHTKRSLSEAGKKLIDFVQSDISQFKCNNNSISDPLRALSALHNNW